MNRLLWYLIYITLLWGCSASPTGNVAITQTGNPSQVSLAFSAGDKPLVRMAEVPEVVRSFHLTSTTFLLREVTMKGEDSAVSFEHITERVVTLSASEPGIGMDSLIVQAGQRYDSASIVIAPDTEGTLLNGYSMIVDGYINGDSLQAFSCSLDVELTKELELINPLAVESGIPNRLHIVFDYDSWFQGLDGANLNPESEADRAIITESIAKGIFGDGDHCACPIDDDDDDDDDSTTVSLDSSVVEDTTVVADSIISDPDSKHDYSGWDVLLWILSEIFD